MFLIRVLLVITYFFDVKLDIRNFRIEFNNSAGLLCVDPKNKVLFKKCSFHVNFINMK